MEDYNFQSVRVGSMKIESTTDDAETVAMAQFQPMSKRTTTVESVSSRPPDSDPMKPYTVKTEKHETDVDGREMEQDKAAFRARLNAIKESDQKKAAAIDQDESFAVPESVRLTLADLPNGADIYAHWLTHNDGKNAKAISDYLFSIDPLRAAAEVRQLSREYEMGMLSNGKADKVKLEGYVNPVSDLWRSQE